MTRFPYFLFFLLSIITLNSCVKEDLNLLIPNSNKPLIDNFHHKYELIQRNQNKAIGNAELRVYSYETAGTLFYRVDYHLLMKWKSPQYENEQYLQINTRAQVDRYFKLHTFHSRVEKIDEDFKGLQFANRKGFYRPPHYIVMDNDKKYRITAPKGVYSFLVEQYIIHHLLKQQGDAVTYHFFNIVTLNVEQERIQYDRNDFLRFQKYKIPVKILTIKNYTQKYNSQEWVNKKNVILRKTDFDDAILWQLITDQWVK